MSADQRRQVTVEAVVELSAKQNPSDITTAAIAKWMGVTQGALFRHFPSKDDILEAVMVWVSDKLMERMDQYLRGVDSPLDALEKMFQAHVDFVIQYPGVPRMLFGQLQKSQTSPATQVVQKLIKRYSQRLHVLIVQGQEKKLIKSTIDAQAACTMLIGMLQGLVMQSMLAGDASQIRREAPRVFEIYRQGIQRTKT